MKITTIQRVHKPRRQPSGQVIITTHLASFWALLFSCLEQKQFEYLPVGEVKFELLLVLEAL
jgi:hypothetical protein